MVGLDAPLDKGFFDITVGKVVAQVQPDRDDNHVRQEPEPGERRPWWLDWTPSGQELHRSSLPTKTTLNASNPVYELRNSGAVAPA